MRFLKLKPRPEGRKAFFFSVFAGEADSPANSMGRALRRQLVGRWQHFDEIYLMPLFRRQPTDHQQGVNLAQSPLRA